MYNHELLLLKSEIQAKIPKGRSCFQVIDVILSRMVDKENEYFVALDHKWMALSMMATVQDWETEVVQ